MSTIYMHRIDLQSCAHIWLLYIARNLCHCCWWPERWRVEKVCQKRNKKTQCPHGFSVTLVKRIGTF